MPRYWKVEKNLAGVERQTPPPPPPRLGKVKDEPLSKMAGKTPHRGFPHEAKVNGLPLSFVVEITPHRVFPHLDASSKRFDIRQASSVTNLDSSVKTIVDSALVIPKLEAWNFARYA